MKVFTTILFMVLAVLNTSCGDDDSSPNQKNKNSLSVKIDGSEYNSDTVIGMILGSSSNIFISGSKNDGQNVFISIPLSAKAGDTFDEFVNAGYETGIGDEGVLASSGSITITAHNPDTKSVSGTFNFVGEPIEAVGTSNTFTEGKFDVTYTADN